MLFFFSIRSFIFTFCVFLYRIMDLLNIDNHSKTWVFKKFKCLLHKYYPKFTKVFNIVTQNKWKFFKQKNINITKREHVFKGFENTYNISNSFNPELQLKDTDSAIKNMLKKILNELRGVRYFSLLLKDKCISSLFRTKYIEKKLFFLPLVSWTFTLAWATTGCPPS